MLKIEIFKNFYTDKGDLLINFSVTQNNYILRVTEKLYENMFDSKTLCKEIFLLAIKHDDEDFISDIWNEMEEEGGFIL